MTAPGNAPSDGAIARATADLPLPDNPPMATSRGAVGARNVCASVEIAERLAAHRLGFGGSRHDARAQFDLGPDRRPHRQK